MDWNLVKGILFALFIYEAWTDFFHNPHCHDCEKEKELQRLEDQAIIDSAYRDIDKNKS